MAAVKSRVDKKDFNRVLLSETIPSDSPIIFSNGGFYEIVKAMDSGELPASEYVKKAYDEILIENDFSQHHSASIPYKFSILKNETKIRGLSLLHPRAQFFLKTFVKKNFASIIYYCSKSNYSLRKPARVASEYTPKIDENSNHMGVPSFFTIDGIDRLYKFFESNEFVRLESKFPFFASADISNCFNSIYTHTIPWATHGKRYNSSFVRHTNLFANEFDQRMQRSNSNETNGIPIGNEISRIFAEILFQSVDVEIERNLKTHGFTLGVEYQIYRYVDDFFVFSLNRKILSKCLSEITNCLHNLNFVLNDSKTNIYERPYFSKVSCVAIDTKGLLTTLDKSIFDINSKKDDSASFKYTIKEVYKPSGMASKFIARVRSACLTNEGSYADIASLVVGSIKRKVLLVEKCLKGNTKSVSPTNTIILLLEIAFFFYNANPQSSTSRTVCLLVLRCDEIISDYAPEDLQFYREAVKQNIDLVLKGKTNAELDFENGEFLPFEKLNILLSTSFFEDFNKYSNSALEALIEGKKLNYFDVISLLYYTQGSSVYRGLLEKLEAAALIISRNQEDISKCSEKCHLVLDLISCPYISRQTKFKLFKSFRFATSFTISSAELTKAIQDFESTPWFVDWTKKDLKSQIIDKELIRGY